jgi:hypothetical protein
VIRPNPVTIQLRYLQALSDISANQASTIVFPLPIDMIRPLIEAGEKRDEEDEKARPEKALPAEERRAVEPPAAEPPAVEPSSAAALLSRP